MSEQPRSEFLLYQTEDGSTRIQCRLEDETLWLKAIIAEDELAEVATCKEYLQIRAEGRCDKPRALMQTRMQKLLIRWIRLDEYTTARYPHRQCKPPPFTGVSACCER